MTNNEFIVSINREDEEFLLGEKYVNWLDNALFYEIYPVSFFDSDGDGKGDLNGIVEIVLLNPSDKIIERTVKFKKVIKAQNVEICGDKILLKNQSFAILLK